MAGETRTRLPCHRGPARLGINWRLHAPRAQGQRLAWAPESPWPGGCLAHRGDRPLDSRDRGGDAVASGAAWGPTWGLSSAWGHTGGGALARVWGGHLPHPRVPCHRPLPRRLPRPLPLTGSVISGEPDAWFLPVRVRGEGSGVRGRAAKGRCLNGTGARAPSGGSHGKKGGAGELRAFLRG